MASYRRVFRVFLASPGDLTDERRAARDVVDEVATTARELGITLELLGWEDTLPGAQRPQEAINKDVDAAELFVGLLWRRWGQPPGDSEYSSGFEEEFHRADSRRTNTGAPEMWLFFKDVELAQQQDPGDQLQKVLQFRARCESEKKHFYKRFETVDQWVKLFRQSLHRYLAQLSSGTGREPVGEGLEPSSSKTPEPSTGSESADKEAPSLLPLTEIIADLAKGGDPAIHATKEAGLYAARIYLLGLSLLDRSHTSSDLVDTHEMNTLFRLRSSIIPIQAERSLLMRTVLADRVGVKPGWFWFPEDEEPQVNTVAFFAFYGDEEVAKGALALLTQNATRLDSWPQLLFDPSTSVDRPPEIRDAFFKYLETVVVPADLQALEAMVAAGAAPESTRRLVLIARAQTEPGPVLAEIASAPAAPGERLLALLTQRRHEIDSVVLKAAFSSQHNALREMIAAELARRGELDDIRTAAQADASEPVRVLEYRDRLRTAIAAGSERPVVPEGLSYNVGDPLRLERLRGLPADDLRPLIDWFNLDGPEAYEQLASDHWDVVAEEVRSDLAKGFERIRQDSIDRTVKAMLKDAAAIAPSEALVRDIVEGGLKDSTNTFIKLQYVKAAIAALTIHGTKEDIELVRPWIESGLDQREVISVLAKLGSKADVPTLVGIARDTYGDTKVAAAQAAILLSNTPEELLDSFFQSNDADLVKVAAEHVSSVEVLKAKLLPLLNSENGRVRLTAADTLGSRLDDESLLEILNNYTGQATYFYNVAVSLDRRLYSAFPRA